MAPGWDPLEGSARQGRPRLPPSGHLLLSNRIILSGRPHEQLLEHPRLAHGEGREFQWRK